MDWAFEAFADGFDLHFAGRIVVRHRNSCPALAIARGAPNITMYRGNFDIKDAPQDRRALPGWQRDGDSVRFFAADTPGAVLVWHGNRLTLRAEDPAFDRLWLRFHAEPGEAVWGGGEQMSYLALNGRAFPMWTSEPGVGRDKSTELTRAMDEAGMAGGDYWNTNYPQPTFLTSRWLAVHLDEACYSVIDCTDPAAHGVEVWRHEAGFELFAADGPIPLIGALSTRFGRQPRLPDWAMGGAIVGLKQGTRSFDRLEGFIAAGAAVRCWRCAAKSSSSSPPALPATPSRG